MKSTKRSFWLLGFMLLTLCHYVGVAQAKQSSSLTRRSDPSVRLSSEQAKVFPAALETLARQGHATFVVEDQPFAPKLEDEQAVLIASAAPLGEMVERVAVAFDYEVTRRNKIFFFAKRYTDVNDLPGVTPQEMSQTLKDVSVLIKSFIPKMSGASMTDDLAFKNFLLSLTSEQLKLMSEKRLYVRSLNLQQQEQVRRVALHFYLELEAESSAYKSSWYLDGALKEGALAGWRNVLGQRLFGFGDWVNADPKKKRFYPLGSTVDVPSVGLQIGFPDPSGKPYIDPTAPTSNDVVATVARSETTAARTKTLGSVVAALNARSEASRRLKVDDMLAGRPLMLFGEQFAAPETLLHACAEVHGLHVVTETEEEGQTLRLTRPRLRTPQNIAELPAAVRRALPVPYLRALHIADQDRIRAEVKQRALLLQQQQARAANTRRAAGSDMITPAPSALQQARDEEEKQARRKLVARYRSGPLSLRTAAVRRFRATVEPKAKAAPNQQILLSVLDDEEKAALATALVYPFLDGIQVLLNPELPGYVSRLNEMVLAGGKYLNDEGEPRFEMTLCFPRPNSTEVDVVVGFANALIPNDK